MASSSSAVRLLLRDGKSALGHLFRARPTGLSEVAQNVVSVRPLLLLNRIPMTQFPVLSESFPVMQPGFFGLAEKQMFTSKLEAARGKPVVDDEDDEAEDMNDTDFDDGDFEDMEDFDDGEDFNDEEKDFDDDDDDDDDDDENEKHKRTRK